MLGRLSPDIFRACPAASAVFVFCAVLVLVAQGSRMGVPNSPPAVIRNVTDLALQALRELVLPDERPRAVKAAFRQPCRGPQLVPRDSLGLLVLGDPRGQQQDLL